MLSASFQHFPLRTGSDVPIDREGHTFYLGFDAFLTANGYTKREDIPSKCSDQSTHGHLPECRGVKTG